MEGRSKSKVKCKFGTIADPTLFACSNMRAPEKSPPGLRLPYLTPWALKMGKWANRNCLWCVPTREKVVALTFDDGPSLRHMPALLEALRKHRMHATFFVLGNRIDDTPDGQRRRTLLEEAVRDGHEIALHGDTHDSLLKTPDAEIQTGVERLRARLQGLPVSRFYRPPFGHINARVAGALASIGCTAVNASILPGDSFLPKGWEESPERSTRRILRELHPGAIICLHIGEDLGIDDAVYPSPHASEIVERLAPELARRGYRTATLSEFSGR